MLLNEVKELMPTVRTPSVNKLVKKYGIPSEKVLQALKKGTKVEKEHTKKCSLAKEIALDHLGEDPKYYDKLAKIEK